MNTLQTYLRDLSEWVQQDRHLFFLGFPLMIKDLGNKFIILFKGIVQVHNRHRGVSIVFLHVNKSIFK